METSGREKTVDKGRYNRLNKKNINMNEKKLTWKDKKDDGKKKKENVHKWRRVEGENVKASKWSQNRCNDKKNRLIKSEKRLR